MWTITLRDLQVRKRQFGIAVVGAGLVFALTLVLTGMSAGFYSEAGRTVDRVGADRWIVANGVTGPFTAQAAFDATAASGVQGAQRVDPLVIFPASAVVDGSIKGVNVIGHPLDGLGAPKPSSGRAPRGPGEALVDSRVGAGTGDKIELGGRTFVVTGKVNGSTYFGGIPIVYVPLLDAQWMAFQGRPAANALVTKGTPTSVPSGFTVLTNDAVYRDVTRTTASARKTIASTRAFMWVVGIVIIGAVTYLSALERVRDFAVLKAVGSSSRTLVASISIQAVLASVLSALLAILLAQVLKPTFTLPITITGAAYVALPILAVVVGLVASMAAVRRAMRVDPALAFG